MCCHVCLCVNLTCRVPCCPVAGSVDGVDLPAEATGVSVVISSFRSHVVKLRVAKKPGMEQMDLLSDDADESAGLWGSIKRSADRPGQGNPQQPADRGGPDGIVTRSQLPQRLASWGHQVGERTAPGIEPAAHPHQTAALPTATSQPLFNIVCTLLNLKNSRTIKTHKTQNLVISFSYIG